jgi:hypothetical protein
MATPLAVDNVTVASTAAGVAPTALATAIATLQAVATTSCERAVSAVVAARPHPPTGLPFFIASASAPAGPTAVTTSPLAATAIVGAPTGTVAGATDP